jgi:hypothetical protein
MSIELDHNAAIGGISNVNVTINKDITKNRIHHSQFGFIIWKSC